MTMTTTPQHAGSVTCAGGAVVTVDIGPLIVLSPVIRAQIKNSWPHRDVAVGVALPEVSDVVLLKILGFCADFLRLGAAVTSKWEADFSSMETSTLCEIASASHHLQLSSLIDASCKAIAALIKGKTPAEIRATFNIPYDFEPGSDMPPPTMRDKLRNKLIFRARSQTLKKLSKPAVKPHPEQPNTTFSSTKLPKQHFQPSHKQCNSQLVGSAVEETIKKTPNKDPEVNPTEPSHTLCDTILHLPLTPERNNNSPNCNDQSSPPPSPTSHTSNTLTNEPHIFFYPSQCTTPSSDPSAPSPKASSPMVDTCSSQLNHSDTDSDLGQPLESSSAKEHLCDMSTPQTSCCAGDTQDSDEEFDIQLEEFRKKLEWPPPTVKKSLSPQLRTALLSNLKAFSSMPNISGPQSSPLPVGFTPSPTPAM
ncbi:hypothetical protein Pelo_1906 [Pelomyxa schiedti]|nr:hypothetical protein Pelo_1906 [Pelomyxa schiedti]